MNKQEKITEKIKTFEDACEILGIDPESLPAVENLPEKDRQSIIAYYKLAIITRALNEGWEPDWMNRYDYKYWNWFYTVSDGADAGFAYAREAIVPSYTKTAVGSRLCFKTRELAAYAHKNFRDLYFEYLFINMPKNYKK
jgi:hypothetical protein